MSGDRYAGSGVDGPRQHVRHQGTLRLLQENQQEPKSGVCGFRRGVCPIQTYRGYGGVLRTARSLLEERRQSGKRRGTHVLHRPLGLASYLAGEEHGGLPQPLPHRFAGLHVRCVLLHAAYRPRVTGEIPRRYYLFVGLSGR